MKYLLVEVLGSGPEHELLVDLLVEFGAAVLQLSAACLQPGVRALKKQGENRVSFIRNTLLSCTVFPTHYSKPSL